MPVRSATVHTPMMAVKAPISFPPAVIGDTSPYPTVVSVTIDHHIVSGIDGKASGCASCSATYINELERNKATTIRYSAATNACRSE